MADERQVNEVVLNGTTILTTRGDTVAPTNLLDEETATNRAGEKIEGEIDAANAAETYMITDPIADIEEEDYIPFNDISDTEMPKKKTLFSDFIEKLRSFFVSKSGVGANFTIDTDNQTMYLKHNKIDASKVDNNVASTTYPSTSNILDKEGRIIMRTEAVVIPDGRIGWKAYVNNYDTDGTRLAQRGLKFYEDKTGAMTFEVDDPRAFRKAVDSIDQLGTSLPRNTVIDDYHTDSYTGTYYFADDGVASTIVTLPEAICGKLVVTNNGNGGFSQYYIPNHSVKIWVRVWWSNAWSAWQNLASGSKPHTYESGTSISENADLNDYKTEGVYTTVSDAIVATLSNTPTDKAGQLIVSKIVPSGNYQMQYYITTMGEMYTRIYNNWNTSWSNWENVASGMHTYEIDTEIPANANLNTYTTAGVYQCGLTATARTMSNLPYTGNDRLAFKLIVMKIRNSNNLIQWYIPYDNLYTWVGSKIAYRTTDDGGSSWRDWVIVARYHDIVHQYLGTTIPDNSNLNNYTTNGIYNVSTNSSAETISNMPYQRAGKLVVMRIAGNQYVKQFYIPYGLNENARIASRSVDASASSPVWSVWSGLTEQTLLDSGNVYVILSTKTSTEQDYHVGIKARIEETTTGQIYVREVLKIFQDHQANSYGFNLLLEGGGNTVIGSGEAASSLYPVLEKTKEDLHLISDANLNLISKANTISERVGLRLDTNGRLVPINANGLADNLIDLGWTTAKYANLWVHKINGAEPATVDNAIISKKDITTAVTSLDTIPLNSAGTITLDASISPTGAQLTFLYICYGNNRAKTIEVTRYNHSNKNTEEFWKNSWGDTSGWTGWMPLSRQGTYVGTCNTEGSQRAKVATVDDDFSLKKGVRVGIKFTYTNTYSSATANPVTLNVNNTGAKNIWYNNTHSGAGNTGVSTKIYGIANRYIFYIYDGTYWVWDSHSCDDNSTNFLRNDASSTLTTSSPQLRLKATNIDAQQANNGVTSNTFGEYRVLDKSDLIISDIYSMVQPNGRIGTFLQARNYNGSTTSVAEKNIGLSVDKNGNAIYTVDDARNLHAAVGSGYGTCSTAADQRVKAVTLANFVLVVGGIIGVKFTYSNTYSATADNKVCLNVNNTGEKPIYYAQGYPTGTNTTAFGFANRIHYYMYDGTNWVWLNHCIDNDGNNRKSFYATCTTAADQQVKVATLADSSGWELRAGTIVGVRFTNSNSFSSQTSTPIQLNVNNTGAKNIWYGNAHSGSGNTGTNTRIYGEANRVFTYMYDGTYWVWQSCGYEADTVDPRNLGSGYGTCDTAASTAAKVVTMSGYNLRTGGILSVKFTNAVPANATMNINSRGAKNIWYRGANVTANVIQAGDLVTFVYDGTRYQILSNDRWGL